MQVFAILHASRPDMIGAAIARVFPHDHLALQAGQWIVAGSLLTSRDVCDRLGVTDGENGNAIVIAMDAYWGRAAGSIWEWVSARKAANGQ